MEAWERAVAYHERTKHALQRYARGPGELDWANQPDPFRRYVGAPLTLLSLATEDDSPPYESLYAPSAGAEFTLSPGAADAPPHPASRGAEREGHYAPARSAARDSLSTPCAPARPLNFDSISRFFELSLSISAWKEFNGMRWALRCNPSSGNLHPTEGYAILPALPGLHETPAVHHYAPREHGLERRADFDDAAWARLARGFPPGSFLVGLSSIHWREAWKYGERAYRYCQHDVGHAIGALRFSAAALGWRMRVLEGMGDADIAAILGIDRALPPDDPEREHPDILAAVMPAMAADSRHDRPWTIPSDVIDPIARGRWLGRANRLSPEHTDWEAIDAASQACTKQPSPHPRETASPARKLCEDRAPAREPEQAASPWELDGAPFLSASKSRARRTARDVIRSRRSAVAYDGTTSLSREQFFFMLSRTLPRRDRAPWDVLGPPTAVHLLMMVHFVDGL
ncbi:MAG: SagB/ThcOx family dehydrogenase, partial [Chloroflexi bacterium]|nr:SagB/ThcOx family dehydrogenase [Chloroflexota bacterium]